MQHHSFFSNLLTLFNRKTRNTKHVTQSSFYGTSSLWSVWRSKWLGFHIFASEYTASDNRQSVSFWPTFPPTTHYSSQKYWWITSLTNLVRVSAASDRWFLKNINSVRSPLSDGLLTAFTKLGDHQRKNWTENNYNEVKSSVFTSIDLRVISPTEFLVKLLSTSTLNESFAYP